MNYNKVPNIISSKDLDYLSDMFQWNLVAYKHINNSINNVIDKDIKKMLKRVSDVYLESMKKILNILERGNNGSN